MKMKRSPSAEGLRRLSAGLLFTVLLAAGTVRGQSVWYGGLAPQGNNANWNVASNWLGGTIPAGSSNLIFGASFQQTSTNDIAGLTPGWLRLTADGFTLRGNSLTLSSGLTNETGSSTVGLPVTLGAAQTWNGSDGTLTVANTVNNGGFTLTVTNSANVTISGAISGAGGLTKNGAGTLVLSGTNTFAGTTALNAGLTRLIGPPASPVSGALYWINAVDAQKILLATGVATWGDSTSNGLAFTQGTAVNQPAFGTNSMNGLPAVRFDGAAKANNDRMAQGTATAPASVFIVNKPKFDTTYKGLAGMWGQDSADYGVRAGSSTSWNYVNSGDWAFPGSGTHYVNGAATSSFGTTTAAHLFEGMRTSAAVSATYAIGDYWNSSSYDRVYAGDIGEILAYGSVLSATDRQTNEKYLMAKWLGVGMPLATNTVVQLSSGATLDLNGAYQNVAGLTDGTGGGLVTNSATIAATLALSPASGTGRTFSGVIADAGAAGAINVIISGLGGTQALNGASSYSGGTTVAAGTLRLGNASALGSASGALGINGGTLDLAGNSITVGSLAGPVGAITTATGTPTLTVNQSTNTVFSGTLQNGSGTNYLTKAGTGTLTLSGANITYTGGTRIDGGLLQLTNTTAFASAGITNNGVVEFGLASGNLTYANYLCGTGSIVKTGSSTLYLTTKANTFSGGAVINQANLALGNGANENAAGLGSGTITVNTGGTLWLNPGSTANHYYIANPIYLNGGYVGGEDGNQHLTGPVAIGPNGGYLAAKWNGKDLYVDGILSGTTPLTVTYWGGGATPRVYFSNAANTYSGTVTVNNASCALTFSTPYALTNGVVNVAVADGLRLSGITAATLGGLQGSGNLTTLAGCTLSVGRNNGSTTYSGVLSSSAALTKVGTGLFMLSGSAQTYSGATTVSAGRLVLGSSATVNSSPTLAVAGGATLDVSAFTSGYALQGTQTLLGGGVITGSVSTASGTVLAPGTLGTAGTLTFTNNLTLSAGTTNVFDLTSTTTPGGANDLLNVAGNFTNSGATIAINPIGVLSTTGTYRLVNIGGNKSGTFAGVVSAVPTSRTAFTLQETASAVDLQVTATSSNLVWKGGTPTWDLNNTASWNNNTEKFFNGDAVTFDDTGASSVSLSGTLLPGSVMVSSTQNYAFSGAGVIGGGATLTKTGTGTLTLSTANTCAGGMTVSGGQLTAGSATALGAGGNIIAVTNGATLAIGGNYDLRNYRLVIAGAGLGGNGAIVNNSGSTADNGFASVTLAGDATIGGSTRWSMQGVSEPPVLDLAGYTLTRINTTQFWFGYPTGGLITDGQLAINGHFGIRGGSKITGNGTFTVNTGGTLGFWEAGNLLARSVVLNGGTIANGNGASTISGTLAISTNGSVVDASNGADITLAGAIGGTGNWSKTGGNGLTISGSNTYSGTLTISGGNVYATHPRALGTGAVAVSGGQLWLNAYDPFTLANNVTGANNVILNNPSLLTMDGTASINISGTVYAGYNTGANALVTSTGSLTAGALRLGDSGSGTIHTLTVDGGSVTAGALYVAAGASGNTPIGTLLINGGSVSVTTAGTAITLGDYGNGQIVLRGGQFTYSGTSGIYEANNGGTSVLGVSGGLFSSPNSAFFLGVRGTGYMVISGTGTVDLAAQTLNLAHPSTTGTGIINLNGGTLRVGAISKPNASATGTLNFNGGTLQAGASTTTFLQGITAANVQDGGAVIDSASRAIAIGQNLLTAGSGVGGLVKIGAGTLTLQGANTYGGGTTVSNGVLLVDAISDSATSRIGTSGTLTLAGGTLLYSTNTAAATARSIVLRPAGTVEVGANVGVLSFGGTVSGGAMLKAGAGQLFLGTANTYTGATTVALGTLKLGASGTIASTPSITVASGSTFDVSAVSGYTLGSSQTLAGSGSVAGSVTTSSGSTVSPGTPGVAMLTYPAYVPSSSATMFNNQSVASLTNATGSFQGGWIGGTIPAAVYYFRNTGIQATYQLQIYDGSYTKCMKVQLDQSGANITGYEVYAKYKAGFLLGQDFDSITSDGAPPVGSGGYGTVNTTLLGSGTTGAGTLTLANNLTLATGTTNAFDLGSATTAGGGTNDLIVVSGNLVNNGSILYITASQPLTNGAVYRLINYAGTKSGSGGWTVSNGIANTRYVFTVDESETNWIKLAVSGGVSNLTWTGGTPGNYWDVNTSTNWSPAGLKFTQGDSVTFDDTSANTNVTLVGSLLPALVGVTNSTRNYTFLGAGAIAGNTALNKAGTGTLTIRANNTYTGLTTVTGGTLLYSNITSIAGSVISNNANVAFGLGVGSNYTHTGTIVGTGTLTKSGPGNLTVSALNTYTGVTTVASGSLTLSGVAPTNTPPATGSLIVWLDAYDVNGNGVQPTNGTAPAVWANKATVGSVGNFAQYVSGAPAPVFFNSSTGFGGRPAIKFYGNNNGQSLLWNNSNFAAPCSIFVVSRLTGEANYRLIAGQNNNWLLGYHGGSKDCAHFTAWVTATSAGPTPNADLSATLYGAVIPASGTTYFYRNGAQLATSTSLFVGPNGLRLGGSGSEHSYGEVTEVLIYNTALSIPQRQQVEAYLMTKWGLGPLPDRGDVVVNSGATLDMNGCDMTASTLNGSGSVVNNSAGTVVTIDIGANNASSTFSGLIGNGVGTIALSKRGSGTFTISGSSPCSITGLTSVDAGYLTLNNSAGGVISGNLLGNNYNTPYVVTLANNQFSTNTVASFLNANAYTRCDLMGTIQTLAGINDTTSRGIFQHRESAYTQITGASTLVLAGSGTYAFNGYVRDANGTLALVKSGTGTQTLTGSYITYTGSSTLSGGLLTLYNTTAFASGTINNSAALRAYVDGNNTAVIASILAGAGTWTVDGPGGGTVMQNRVVLRGNGSTSTSAIGVVNSGKLWLDRAVNAIGDGQVVTLGASATFFLYSDATAANQVNETIGGLSGTGNVYGYLGGGSVQPALTVGGNNASASFAGAIGDQNGSLLRFAKTGTGTQTLSGVSTFGGPTTISAGSLALTVTNALSGSPTITLAGGTLDVAGAAGYTLVSGKLLEGVGSVTGNVSVASGARLAGNNSNATDRITFNSNLTLSAGVTNWLDLSGGTGDVISVLGTLSPNGGKIGINTLNALTNGIYRLFNYGSMSGAFDTNVVNASRRTMTLDTNNAGQVNLIVGGAAASITWLPTVNATWDIQASSNWLNGAATDIFCDWDTVLFSDLGGSTGSVTLAQALRPYSVIVNSSSNYTFGGSGKITGLASLLKTGSGTLTVTTANDFTGSLTVSNGALRIAGNNAFTTGIVPVAPGAAIELFGGVTAANNLQISGSGPGDAGAIRNVSGNNAFNGILDLRGDTRIASDSGTLTMGATATNQMCALTFGGAGNITRSGQITGGNGSVIKDGSGTLTLNGYCDYTYGTVVSNGVLMLGYASGGYGTLRNALTVASPGTVNYSVANSFGWNNPITVLNILGATVGGNDYGQHFWSGTTFNFVGGTLNLGGTLNECYSPTITASNAATTAQILGVTASAVIRLRDGSSAIINVEDGPQAIDLLIDVPIQYNSGTSSLTKNGAGTLKLTKALTYNGNTTINAGPVILGASATISSSPIITFGTGASLDVSAISGFTLAGTQTLQGYGSVTGAVTTSSGTKLIPGGAARAGTLAFSTNLTLNAGTTSYFELAATPDVGGGTNDLVSAGGNLAGAGSRISIGLLTPPTNGTYRLFEYAAALTSGFDTNLLGGNTTRKTWVLDTNTPNQVNLIVTGLDASNLLWRGYASSTWDVGGAGTVNWSNTLGGASQFFDGDYVTFDDQGATNNTITINSTVYPGMLTVSSSSNYTFTGSGGMMGQIAVTKSGSGTLTVACSNQLFGTTTVGAGELRIVNAAASGSLGYGPVVNNSSVVFDRTDYFACSNALSGAGSITKMGAGTNAMAANSTCTGPIAVNAGAMEIGAGGASGQLGTSAISLTGTTLRLNRSDDFAITNSLSGSGTLYKLNANNATYAGNSSLSGNLQSAGGTITVAPTAAATNLALVYQNSGGVTATWTVNGILTAAEFRGAYEGGNWGTSRSTLNVNSGATATFGTMNISRIGWSQDSTATTTLNVYTGGVLTATTIQGYNNDFGAVGSINPHRYLNVFGGRLNATTINLAPGGDANTVRRITLDGGTLAHNPGADLTVDSATRIVLNPGSGSLDAAAGRTITINAAVQGTGNLIMTNAGTCVLSSANTFTGEATVSNGTVQAGNTLALQYSTINLCNDAARLTFSSGVAAASTPGIKGIGSVNLTNLGSAPVALTVGASTNLVYNGVMGGSGSLVKTGTGTQTLTGTNTYTGATTVNSGTLALAGSGSIANSSSIAVTGTLDVASLSSTFTVASGQRLLGSGTVSGNAAADAGAALLPGGVASPGTLSITGNLALNASSTNVFDLNTSHAVGGGTNDLLVVGGTLTPNGARVVINLINPPTTGAYRLVTAGAISGTFNATVLGNTTRMSASLSYGATYVDLVFGGDTADLAWLPTNAVWDVTTTTNWYNSGTLVPDMYYQSDNVTFGDAGAGISTVLLSTALMPSSVTVNSASNFTFSGAGQLTGAIGITKTGTGTLTLQSPQANTGTLALNGGALELRHDAAVGPGSIAMASGTKLVFASGSAGLVEGTYVGNPWETTRQNTFNSLQLSTTRLNSQSGFGGNTEWDYEGQFYVNSTTNVTWTFGECIDDNAYLSIDGVQRFSDGTYNNVTIANVALTPGWHRIDARGWNGGGGAGPAAVNGWTTTMGIGVDILGRGATAGANFTPLTDPGDGSFLTHDVIVTNGVSLAAGSQEFSTPYSYAGGYMRGSIGGSGQVVKTGPSTLILTTNSTFTGGLVVSNGTVQLWHNNAAGAGTITLAGGTTLSLGMNSPYVTNALSVAGNATLASQGTGFTGMLAGSIGNGGSTNLFKTGIGDIVIGGTAANTFTGTVTLTGTGQLGLSKTNAVAVAGDMVMNASGTRSILWATQNNQFGTNSVMRWAGSGDTRFELNGTTQTLAGVDSTAFVPGTYACIQHREFATGAAGSANDRLVLNVASNTAYLFGNAGGTAVIRDYNGGSVSLTKNGAGTQTLQGPGITYTGNTTLSAGTLLLSGASGFNSAIALNGGTLRTDTSASTVSLPKVISGNSSGGRVTFTGGNWTYVTADMTYTGGTVAAGNMILGNSTAAGSVLGPIYSTGVLRLYRNDAFTFMNDVTGSGTFIVTCPGNNTNTLTGNITCNGFYVDDSGVNGYVLQTAGNVVVSNSAANLFRIAHWSGTGVYTITGGTITNLNGYIAVGWDGGGTLNIAGGAITTPQVALKVGGGSGAVNMTDGSLTVGGSGITGTGTLTFGGGTLRASASWSTTLGINIDSTNAVGTLTVNPSDYTITLGGAVAGGGGLALAGTGSGGLILSGANTYAGTTTVSGSILQVNSTHTSPGAYTVSGGYLTLGGSAVVTVPTLTLSGNAVLNGSGRINAAVTVQSAATVSGSTTLGSNVVIQTGGTVGGSGKILGTTDVQGGAILTGTLTSSNAVTVRANGTLDPGIAGLGTLTTYGLTLETNAIVRIATAGSGLIQVTNSFTTPSGGTSAVVNVSSVPGMGQYQIIKYPGAIAGGGVGGLRLGSLPRGVIASLVDNVASNSVDLSVTAVGTAILTFKGNQGTAWDINTTTNWLYSNTPDKYYDGDYVLFDDTPVANYTAIPASSVLPGKVTFSNSVFTATLSGANGIGGSAQLWKYQNGLARLWTTNTYGGGTFLAGGTLQFGNSALGGGSITFTNNATLQWASGNIQDVSSYLRCAAGVTGTLDTAANNVLLASTIPVANWAGALRKAGAGTLTMGGANTYTGATVVSTGTLILPPGASLANTAAITVDTGATMLLNGSANNQIQSAATAPSLTVNGTMRVTTATAHTLYATTLTMNNGTLASDLSVGSYGAYYVGGSRTLTANGSSNLISAVNVGIASAQTLTVNTPLATDALTLSSALFANSGTVYLTKNGSGTVTLSGSVDNASVGLTANAGTLILAKSSSATAHAVGSGLTVAGGTALISGTGGDQVYDGTWVAVNSGSFDMNGLSETIKYLSGSGGYVTNNSGTRSVLTIALAASGSQSYSGTIGTNVQVRVFTSNTKNTDTQAFAGNNTYIGGTIISNGHLRITSDAGLGAVPATFDPSNVIIMATGVLQNNDSSPTLSANRGIYLGTGGGVFYAGWSGNSRTFTINGAISGPGSLTMDDGAALVLGGTMANSYSGGTTFRNGRTDLAKTPGVNAIPGDLTFTGSPGWAGTMMTAGVRLLANEQIADTSLVSWSSMGNAADLRVRGCTETIGGLVYSAGNSYAIVENNGPSDNVSSNGTLILNVAATNSLSFNGQVRDQNSGGTSVLNLTKTGTGTQTLAGGSITYSGATTVSAGTLILDQAVNHRNTAINVDTSGTLVINATGALDTWYFSNGKPLSGSGTIVKTGSGWVQFRGSSPGTFSGMLVISNGTFGSAMDDGVWTTFAADVVAISNASALGILDLRSDPMTLDSLSGGGEVWNSWTSQPQTLTVGAANGSGSFSGRIRGAGGGAANTADANTISLIKNGTGTQTLSGSNTYTGSTTVNAGRLTYAGGTATHGTFAVTGGTLEFSGGTISAVAGAGTRDVNVTGSATVLVSNAGSFIVPGTLALGAGSSQSGSLTITGGSLAVNGNDGTRGLTLGEYSGGTGTLTMSGGTLTATGQNTYLAWNGSGVWNQSAGAATLLGLCVGSSYEADTGTLTLTGGSITIGANGITKPYGSSTANLNLGGGTLASSASWSSSLPMTLTGTGGSATIAPAAATTISLSGDLTGAGGLIKTGTGTLSLSYSASAATYSAGTIVSNGVLTLGGGNNGYSTVGSGTLTISTGATVIATAHNVLGHTADANVPDMVINGGALTPAEYLHVEDIDMTAGTINAGSSAGGSGLDVSHGTRTIASHASATSSTIAAKMTISGTATFSVENGTATTDLAVTGEITGAGALTKSGSGLMTLSSSGATYTGDTTITAGTLAISSSSTFYDNSRISINGTGILDIAGGVNETVRELRLNNATMWPGTWGSASSAADNKDTHFTGTGILTVMTGTPNPATLFMFK